MHNLTMNGIKLINNVNLFAEYNMETLNCRVYPELLASLT